MPRESVIEMVDALEGYVGRAKQDGATVTADSAIGYMALWTDLNGQGMTKDGIASTVATADRSLRRGGAMGMASKMASYRAMTAHGITDPYTMERLQSRGAFALLPDGSFLIAAQVNEIVREMAGQGQDATDNAGSNHLGVTMDQFQALRASLKETDTARFRRNHPTAIAFLKQCFRSSLPVGN